MLLSEAFYTPLQTLEVCLRNSLDSQLTLKYGANWLLDPTVAPLNDFSRSMINEATKAADNPPTHGKVIAESKFAFWVGLTAKGYDSSIWRAAAYRAFLKTGGVKRSIVHGRLNSLRRFRNRIAHHEPIFHKDVASTHNELIEAIFWMCRDTAEWARHHSSVEVVLERFQD